MLFVWIKRSFLTMSIVCPIHSMCPITCEFHITNQPQEETTLVSSNLPTDRPTTVQPLVSEVIYSEFPSEYLSVRITILHSQWQSLFDSCFFDAAWYISYPHMGKNGNNPHFHVLLPAHTTKDSDRIRKQIKTAGYTGNKQFGIKFMQNGLQCGIQYCSRQGTAPTQSRSQCQKWISGSPTWLNCNLKENFNKRAREDLDNGIKLIIVNHLRLAWKYRLQHDNLKNEDRLPHVVMHMLDDGFYIDPAWLSESGTDFYVEVFRTSCKAGKLTFQPSRSVWSQVLWKPSRFEYIRPSTIWVS